MIRSELYPWTRRLVVFVIKIGAPAFGRNWLPGCTKHLELTLCGVSYVEKCQGIKQIIAKSVYLSTFVVILTMVIAQNVLLPLT